MPVALKPGSTREYVLSCERPRENEDGETVVVCETPTVFLLRNLTLGERQLAMQTLKASIKGDINRLDKVKLDFEAYATILRLGLAGWRDYPDQEGGELIYETEEWTAPDRRVRQAIKRELIDYIETGHAMELANAIADQNQLKETDRGNSRRSD